MDFDGAMVLGREYHCPRQFHLPSPKSIIGKCKIYNRFWWGDDIGRRISSPGANSPPRIRKVSSGNVKFTMDFDGAMIHGRKISSPRGNSTSPSPKSIIRKCKFTMDFGGAMIHGRRISSPEAIPPPRVRKVSSGNVKLQWILVGR